MTLGLFGGTFDPVHLGHLDVARAARAALDLDTVWLMPARQPPHRSAPFASAAHRFAMAALAVQDETGFIVSDLEMETIGPSYTVETLDRLEARGVDLQSACFIIGADAFRDIPLWKDYARILDRCHFVVVSRPGVPAPGLRHAMPELAHRMLDSPCDLPSHPSILLVDTKTSAVSSTDVRRAQSQGQALTGLLPASVAAYVTRQGLYAGRDSSGPGPKGVA